MNDFKKYLAEGIGTMFLVLLACGSAVLAGPSIGGYGIGVCFGLVLHWLGCFVGALLVVPGLHGGGVDTGGRSAVKRSVRHCCRGCWVW